MKTLDFEVLRGTYPSITLASEESFDTRKWLCAVVRLRRFPVEVEFVLHVIRPVDKVQTFTQLKTAVEAYNKY